MAIFKIKDGFSIVDSNNVESRQISGVATAISNNPSDSNIPTEKAVADAIAGGGGGGGGAGSRLNWQYRPHNATTSAEIYTSANPDRKTICVPIVIEGDTTPTAIRVAFYSEPASWPLTITAAIGNWPLPQSSGYASPEIRYSGTATFANTSTLENGFTYLKSGFFFLDVPMTWRRGTKTFNAGQEAVVFLSFDKFSIKVLASSSTSFGSWNFISTTTLDPLGDSFTYGTVVNLKQAICVGIIG